jgi:hypothetical protein
MATIATPTTLPDDDQIRESASKHAENKYRAWKFWAGAWGSVHLIFGGSSVILATLIAVNEKNHDVLGGGAIWLAVIAAFVSFVLTTWNPQKHSNGFLNAYRHLEGPKDRFEYDKTMTVQELNKVMDEAIKLL